jgi:hypothetical protein
MNIIKAGNDYIKTMDAWDVGLLKTALFSLGVLVGMSVRKEDKKKVAAVAGVAYGVTLTAIMIPFVKHIIENNVTEEELEPFIMER